MKVRANDLVDAIRQVEFIKSSKVLSPEQKQVFYRELETNLPLDIFCSSFPGMRQVAKDILKQEIKDDRPRPTKETSPAKKSTPKAKNPPQKSNAS